MVKGQGDLEKLICVLRKEVGGKKVYENEVQLETKD